MIAILNLKKLIVLNTSHGRYKVKQLSKVTKRTKAQSALLRLVPYELRLLRMRATVTKICEHISLSLLTLGSISDFNVDLSQGGYRVY